MKYTKAQKQAIKMAQEAGIDTKDVRFYKQEELIKYKNGHYCVLHKINPDGTWQVGWPNGEYTNNENPEDFTLGWE